MYPSLSFSPRLHNIIVPQNRTVSQNGAEMIHLLICLQSYLEEMDPKEHMYMGEGTKD